MKKTEKIMHAVERHLHAMGRGKERFDMANRHLQRARKHGLRSGDIVAIGNKKFQAIDNTDALDKKGCLYRPARLPAFELKEISEAAAARAQEEAA